MIRKNPIVALLGIDLMLAATSLCAHSQAKTPVPPRPWYVSAAAIHRVMLKPEGKYWRFEQLSMEPAKAEQQMRRWKAEGINALEIFAPEEGGNSYDGLDAKNRFRLDPELGNIRDFRRLVTEAHRMGLSVVTFQNLGYSSLDAPQFLKAEDDIRHGRETRETRFFFWSRTSDAPPPVMGNSYFLIRPNQPGYDSTKNEFWQWSDRAQSYYWTRWPGKDADGQTIHLPQYNWAGPEWPTEAQKVVRFWMNTGLDGMILDAVNWYAGATWNKINENITAPIASYGDKFIQPEGGGAFHTDDPEGWITAGHFTNLIDYGSGIWWEKNDQALRQSVETGNPRIYENALRAYHDRVVAAGGTLYMPIPNLYNLALQQLAEALLATSGDLLCYCNPRSGINQPAPGLPELLKLKAIHPALYQSSSRRRIPTSDDEHFYATLRDAADHSERLLVVLNFQRQSATAEVDLGAIQGSRYVAIDGGGAPTISGGRLQVPLSGFGHRIFVAKME